MTRAELAPTDPVLHSFAAEIGNRGLVSIAGRGTRWSAAGEIARDVRILRAPTGIVEVSPAEMTVRVRAGTLVADLNDALAEVGQRSALPERGGTVGGAVAVGEDHLDVLGRGRMRDSVLQVRYVSAEGRLVSAGGAVVKNVSGFNLPKLITGSFGTLGAIAEVVLRTNPKPSMSQWLVACDADPQLSFDMLYRPSCVLWDGARTWVHLEGHAVDVAAESDELQRVGIFEPVDSPPSLPAHRWALTPRGAASMTCDEAGSFVASIGVGTLWADRPQEATPIDAALKVVHQRAKSLFDPTGRLNPGRAV
jgi:FAD/FMN-containing dehydrogenase